MDAARDTDTPSQAPGVSPEPPSPALWGGATVFAVTFLCGLALAVHAGYLTPEGDWKFGRHGLFQLVLFIYCLLAVCNVAAFLLTSPIYNWLRLPRTKIRIVTHAILGTIFAVACFWFGLSMRLSPLLPHASLSNNGILEIAVLTTLVAIFPYLLVMAGHAAYERMRRAKAVARGE